MEGSINDYKHSKELYVNTLNIEVFSLDSLDSMDSVFQSVTFDAVFSAASKIERLDLYEEYIEIWQWLTYSFEENKESRDNLRRQICTNIELQSHHQEMLFKMRENLLKENFDSINRLKEILFELGLIRMSLTQEYKVNRSADEVANGLGIHSMSMIESQILIFYKNLGISRNNMDKEAFMKKLICWSWGCGNASVNQHQRFDGISVPLKDGLRIVDYWEHYGIADRLYFSIEDTLRSIIKNHEDEDDNQNVTDFIEAISSLILRRVFSVSNKYDRKVDENLSKIELDMNDEETKKSIEKDIYESLKPEEKLLLDFKKDKNLLWKILFNADLLGIVKESEKINGKGFYLADGEFPGDHVKEIENDMVKIIFRDLARCYNFNSDGLSDLNEKVKDFLNQIFENDVWDRDLNKIIPANTHNVLFLDFNDAAQKMSEAHGVHFVYAFRSNSHLNNKDYKDVVKFIVSKLAPGGVYIDDGDRESYSGYWRINVITEIMDDLGDEYNLQIIADDSGKEKSFMIQRGVKIGSKIHFFDKKNLERIKSDDSEFINPIEFKSNNIVSKLRNNLIKIFRKIPLINDVDKLLNTILYDIKHFNSEDRKNVENELTINHSHVDKVIFYKHLRRIIEKIIIDILSNNDITNEDQMTLDAISQVFDISNPTNNNSKETQHLIDLLYRLDLLKTN